LREFSGILPNLGEFPGILPELRMLLSTRKIRKEIYITVVVGFDYGFWVLNITVLEYFYDK
jgi:hypothetical protein